ncbi:MAG: phosphatidylglycerol lysyltransferase domain-containing protein [Bacteriovoracaceae bacterium]
MLGRRWKQTFHIIWAFIVIGILICAYQLLHHELSQLKWDEVLIQLKQIKRSNVLISFLFAFVSYFILSLYDYFGIIYSGKSLPLRKILIVSFISNVFSYNFGPGGLSGMALRYRGYSAFNLSGFEISKLIIFRSISFWIGFMFFAGIILIFFPLSQALNPSIHPMFYRLLGGVFLFLLLSYLLSSHYINREIVFSSVKFNFIPFRFALIQLILSLLEWLSSSLCAFYIFKTFGNVSYLNFLTTYLIASLAGIISHIPAGLGIFEGVFALIFSKEIALSKIMSALLLYRFIYYLIPLIPALILLGMFETILFGHRFIFGKAKPNPQDKIDSNLKTIIKHSPETYSNLALLGDKKFLINKDHTAFIMYGIHGKYWFSMGDPVGDEDNIKSLIWNFKKLCDDNNVSPVFYQVDEQRLSYYKNAGFYFYKLGEEAVVELETFNLEGHAHKNLRNTWNKMLKGNFIFEVIHKPDNLLFDQLKQVSDSWLKFHHTREKKFSLGFFDKNYLSQFPIAVIRNENKILAFANIWESSNFSELSFDLMRYRKDNPHGVMDYLLLNLIFWGKEKGYKKFNLGMTPLAGAIERSDSVWVKIQRSIYKNASSFYNFEGLRNYKEKFHPRWRPKYIATSSAIQIPMALMHVSALISRGFIGNFKK